DSHSDVSAFISQAIDYIRGRLALVDITLAQTTRLDVLNKALVEADNQLSTYRSNNSVGHLENVRKQIWGALDNLSFIPIADDKDQLSQVGKVLHEFRKSIVKTEADLDARVVEFTERVGILGEHIVSLESQSEEIKNELKNLKERSDNVVAEFQEQFSRSQAERQSSFNSTAVQQTEQFEKMITEASDQLDEKIDGFESIAAKIEIELINHSVKAQSLVQLISDVAITGGYANAAAQESKSARNMRVGAILTMIVMIALVSVFTYQLLREPQLAWWAILARYAIVLVLLVPAAYLANESRNHRRSADKNRRYQLELTALDPYISDLDKPTQAALKTELAKRYFGKDSETSVSKEEIDASGVSETVLKRVIELVKALR
ncbi:MAG: hypothetical protein WD432_00735, partial [Candidatus Saccharimonadales bacterium]